jgi:Cys-tRNA(Pro)/Cys-tRNA(Cys) deacylase
MTPGINLVKRSKINYQVHEYQHDNSGGGYGLQAAQKMAVAVIPVTWQLSMKLIANACGAKKAVMANPIDVQRSTGYVLGGVSPLGQKKRLTTIIDSLATQE